MTAPHGPRLLVAVTVPTTAAALLTGQLRWCREQGFDVHLVSSPGPTLDDVGRRENVPVHPVPMPRDIDLRADARALLQLVALMVRLRPDVVSAGTPKAGLLVGLAAALTGVPRRVYLLRGLRLEGARGCRRALLWLLERTACRAAHLVICVSPSLRNEAVAQRVVPRGRTRVIGHGSSNGVDPARFAPSPDRDAAATRLRHNLGIAPDQLVVGFVGRLHPDKGLAELLAAHALLQQQMPTGPALLVVGDLDGTHREEKRAAGTGSGGTGLDQQPQVHVLGHIEDPAHCYRAIDVLALPTRREGFPNVVLEAACAEVPAVTTDATGAVDAVLTGVTGTVVPTRDAPALAAALRTLLEDPEQRLAMGRAARTRAERHFRPLDIWTGLAWAYREPPRRRPLAGRVLRPAAALAVRLIPVFRTVSRSSRDVRTRPNDTQPGS